MPDGHFDAWHRAVAGGGVSSDAVARVLPRHFSKEQLIL